MRLFILFNSVFHACALKNSYVYFRSIRDAWIAAECTRFRCSAQKTEYTIGIRRPSRSNVAWSHKLSCLRAKVKILTFARRQESLCDQATFDLEGRLIPMVYSVFWAEQRNRVHSAAIHASRIDLKYTYEFFNAHAWKTELNKINKRMHEKLN